MAADVDGPLWASRNLSSASAKLVEDAVDAVVDGGKLKQFVAGKGPLLPTCGAGDGDREPLPRPLPGRGSCSRSMGVLERSLVEREVRCSFMKPELLQLESAAESFEGSGVPQGRVVRDRRHQMASWPIPRPKLLRMQGVEASLERTGVPRV